MRKIQLFAMAWVAATAAVLFAVPSVKPAEAPAPREAQQFVALQEAEQPKPPKPPVRGRGLKATPKHVIMSLALNKPFRPSKQLAMPASVAYVPKKISMWFNDQYGCCVTTEEAFNQAATGTFIEDNTVYTFAKKNNWLNGAYLTEVMDEMQKTGFQQGGKSYGIGDYLSVDFADENTLKRALTLAPVKIGIDADALPSGAGNKTGWFATGGRPNQFPNEDHCVSLAGFGPAQTLYSALNVALPTGLAPGEEGYLLFTWDTLGFVSHKWLMSTCAEAYIRNPAGTVDKKPVPNPGPGPDPLPPVPPTPPTPPGPTSGVSVLVAGNTVTATNGTDTVTIDYATKTVRLPASWTQGGPTSEEALRADLGKAGVNPMIIIDVLKLVADIKAKAGFDVILADIMKIIADFKM